MPKTAFVLIHLLLPGLATAQTTKPVQTVEPFTTQVTIDVKLDHLVYLPAEYGKDPAKKWPLMIYLHGAGERGSDIEKVKAWGPPKLVEQRPDFPFVLISPQCAEGKWWEPAAVDALLDKALATYNVDPDRVYLTGLSMGGFGTWATAMAYPERFAALAPVCGGGDVWRAPRLKDMPVWAFHGDKDKLVPVQRSVEMVEAIEKAGGTLAKLTRYPDVGHDSWKQAYDTPELYEWLLSHRRKPAAK